MRCRAEALAVYNSNSNCKSGMDKFNFICLYTDPLYKDCTEVKNFENTLYPIIN